MTTLEKLTDWYLLRGDNRPLRPSHPAGRDRRFGPWLFRILPGGVQGKLYSLKTPDVFVFDGTWVRLFAEYQTDLTWNPDLGSSREMAGQMADGFFKLLDIKYPWDIDRVVPIILAQGPSELRKFLPVLGPVYHEYQDTTTEL